MFNLNLKRDISKDGYNPSITVTINDSVTYTLKNDAITGSIVMSGYVSPRSHLLTA